MHRENARHVMKSSILVRTDGSPVITATTGRASKRFPFPPFNRAGSPQVAGNLYLQLYPGE